MEKEWTLPRLSAAAREAHERISSLLASPQALRLREARRAALLRRQHVAAASELLEKLEGLVLKLEELTEGSLDASSYDEAEVALPKEMPRNWNRISSIKPRSTFEGVVYTKNPDAVIASAAPVLSQVLEELELLEDQLRASERADETATILLECVGPPAAEAVAIFANSLPPLSPLALDFQQGTGWTEPGEGFHPRRAYVFHGPGVIAQLEPWLGYARIDVAGKDGSPRRALVRAVLLEGGDGSLERAKEVLSNWDEQAKAEREARRQGAELSEERWPRVVFEREGMTGGGRFVASGLEATAPLAHLAASLRAKAEKLSLSLRQRGEGRGEGPH
jgi:hypothetical protein